MAQSNIITRERATFIGKETTFGTTPSGSFPNAMTRAFPLGDGLILEGLAEEMLPVGDERVREHKPRRELVRGGRRVVDELRAARRRLEQHLERAHLRRDPQPVHRVDGVEAAHALVADREHLLREPFEDEPVAEREDPRRSIRKRGCGQ